MKRITTLIREAHRIARKNKIYLPNFDFTADSGQKYGDGIAECPECNATIAEIHRHPDHPRGILHVYDHNCDTGERRWVGGYWPDTTNE